MFGCGGGGCGGSGGYAFSGGSSTKFFVGEGLAGGMVVADTDWAEEGFIAVGCFFDLVADEGHGGRIWRRFLWQIWQRRSRCDLRRTEPKTARQSHSLPSPKSQGEAAAVLGVLS